MDVEKKFASLQEEANYWRRFALEYKETAAECKEELDEFQLSSRELEAELEVQLSHAEAKNKDLISANCRLQMEVESLRERLEAQQTQSHAKISDLEDELAKVTGYRDELERYIRQLEQANDDLERAKRTTVVSLEDFESKLNLALERNAFLEGELDEKESLACTVQRLKDESRDLHQELAVVKKSESVQFSNLVQKDTATSPVATPTKPQFDNQEKEEETKVSNGLDSNKVEEPVPAPVSNGVPSTPRTVVYNPRSTNGTPLTPSARISALNIVGDLLRKVGALESKLASCRNFVNSQPPRNTPKSSVSSPSHSPRNQRPRSLGLSANRAKRIHRIVPGSSTQPPSNPPRQNIVKIAI